MDNITTLKNEKNSLINEALDNLKNKINTINEYIKETFSAGNILKQTMFKNSSWAITQLTHPYVLAGTVVATNSLKTTLATWVAMILVQTAYLTYKDNQEYEKEAVRREQEKKEEAKKMREFWNN